LGSGVSDESGERWDGLTAAEQKSVDFTVRLLQQVGPMLKMPHSLGVETSRHAQMRELRVQHRGRPHRILYAFDARRTAMLLIGGDKTGNDRWYETNGMPRNYKELQAKMDPASIADNQQRVGEELQRMALEELRSARQLTQTDMAELLDVPQSSISRIEQRADMYLSTLRNYIHAVGGALQIHAIFPDGGTVVIDRFGDYEERPYVVQALAEVGGAYRLRARPLHHQGILFSTRTLKVSGLKKTMRALHLPEPQIASVTESLERTGAGGIEIGGSGPSIDRVFSVPDLVAAGFEAANTE
jgi:DNA-binding XRE family transcriptional regulator